MLNLVHLGSILAELGSTRLIRAQPGSTGLNQAQPPGSTGLDLYQDLDKGFRFSYYNNYHFTKNIYITTTSISRASLVFVTASTNAWLISNGIASTTKVFARCIFHNNTSAWNPFPLQLRRLSSSLLSFPLFCSFHLVLIAPKHNVTITNRKKAFNFSLPLPFHESFLVYKLGNFSFS